MWKCVQNFADRSSDPATFAGDHGTSVASTCCATTNNGRGIASIGWNLRPMALKVDVSKVPKQPLEIYLLCIYNAPCAPGR